MLITPFHNMALMCPATTEADVDRHTEVFGDAVAELFGARGSRSGAEGEEMLKEFRDFIVRGNLVELPWRWSSERRSPRS